MMKRVICLLLVLIMLTGMLPILTLASGAAGTTFMVIGSGYCGDNVMWNLGSDGVLRITGSGKMTNYESYRHAPWYNYRDQIKYVVIGNEVICIGSWAFYDCTSLISISIPDSVQSIGNGAFHSCAKLTSLTIPRSVTHIGEEVFVYCIGLNFINVESNNRNYSSDQGVLFNKDQTLLIQFPAKISGSYRIPDSVTHIGNEAFAYSDLTDITIQDKVTHIGKWAFIYCTELSSVKISNSVTTIEYSAFSYCSSLTSVTLPDGVVSIGERAFLSCTSLSSVTIPTSVASIGAWAFYSCSQLKDVHYAGTRERWNAISIDSYNYPLDQATINYNGVSQEEHPVVFKAEYYANNFDRQFDFENGSYARNYYEGLSNDKSFMNAVKAWEVLHIATDPSYSLESGMISMRDYYRVALFDILCVRTSLDTTTTYVDKIYEEINNDYTNYLISCTAEMMGKQDISPSELKTLQLTEERKQLLLEGTGLGKVAGAADIASKILIGAKSCYDAVDLLSKYCAIRDLNDGTKEVLLAIANDVTNEDELRWAAQDCAECFEAGYSSVVVGLENGAMNIIEDVVGIFVDTAWEKTMMMTPGSAAVFIAAKGVRALTNLFANNDREIEAFYGVKASVQFEYALINVMATQKALFTSSKSSYDAKVYLKSVELYQTTVLLGFDYSEKVLQIAGGSLLSIITEKADDAAALIAEIRSLKAIKIDLYTNFEKSINDICIAKYYPNRDTIIAGLNETPIINFTYSVNSDGKTATITGYTKKIVSVKIPEVIDGYLVTRIGDCALSNCSSLESIFIPDTVTYIGEGAFYYCYNLKGICIPDGVTHINNSTFRSCWNLTSITIPDTVTYIGEYAFYYCSKLPTIFVPNGVTQIGKYAFGECTNLASINIPEGITKVNNATFYSCSRLSNINIPNGVTSIGDNAFQYCSVLVYIYIPDSVTTIGNSAFFWCQTLTEVRLSNNTVNIGEYAFDNCKNLRNINLPNSVVSIGKNAFSRCSTLSSVTIPSSVKTIGSGAFEYCKSLTGIWVDKNNNWYSSDNSGVLFNKDQSELIMFPGGVGGTYYIPDSVTVINQSSFRECADLKSVVFSSDAPNIEAYSFAGTSITAHYPVGKTSWTEDVMQDYGGSVTWVGYHNYKTISIKATCTQVGSVTNTCNICGDTKVEVLPAIGHNYETVTVNATCTVDGSITDTCTACGDTKVEVIPATGHSFVDGICTVCSESDPDYVKPVVVPTLTLKAPALEFKDMIKVIAFFTVDNTESVVEMGMITYTEQVDVVDINTAAHVFPSADYDESSACYFASSQGIHAKFLGDTVYLACYAKLTDGSYVYTKLAPYSPITYAKNQLKNTTDMNLKQLVAAMLNYGAAAQNYFLYNTDTLANASLTDEQKALSEAYRADMVASVSATDVAKQGEFANNKGFSLRKPAVSFEGAFSINYFFTPAYTPVDGITLYYWTEADFAVAEVLTTENASGAIAMDGEGMGQYRGDITGIAAKDLAKAVYVAAVYSDGTTTWTSGVLGYSIGAYCASQSTKGGTIADLAMATAVYGYHAKQYFG